MTIKEASEKYGITADTLRYYERIGLLPPVPRRENGVRDFDETACGYIEFIKCMRGCGVQIEPLTRYVELTRQENTEAKRLTILYEQKDKLERQLRDLNLTLQKLDYKIKLYEDVLKEK